MKILVFTTDLPPLPGLPTSGTALRTNQLAEGFRDLGHDVLISAPRSAIEGLSAESINKIDSGKYSELKGLSFDASNQAKIIEDCGPDLILCGHWPAWTLARKPSQPLIIDLAGPHLLERHFQGEDNFNGAVHGKLNALSSADYFIVSGEKQRLYFLSWLMRARIHSPEKRVCVVTMPLPATEDRFVEGRLKRHSSEDNRQYSNPEPQFIFGGVFLPWQDPSWGLKQMISELDKRNKGTLSLVGGKHPHYDINTGEYDALFDALETNPRVKRKPLLPLEEFMELLPAADVALDLMSWNLERELAITIRTTTYLWAGIPIIYNDYADLASSIKKFDAGWCLRPGDEAGFRAILDEIYSNPSCIARKSKNAISLAKHLFNRKEAAEKIIKLLSAPATSPDSELDILLDIAESCDFTFPESTTLQQRFTCRINGLKEIEVLFGTHAKEINGALEISINEHEGFTDREVTTRSIKTQLLNASELKNNQWIKIGFDPIPRSAGKKYSITMKKKGEGMKNLSPWVIKSNPYPMQGLYKDGQRLGTHSLCLKTHCHRTF